MVYAGVDELKEQYREAAEKAKGRAEGGSSLVRRQAGLKFGADAADEPTRLEGGIADPECIARIGDLTIECEMGTDLLELTARSAGCSSQRTTRMAQGSAELVRVDFSTRPPPFAPARGSLWSSRIRSPQSRPGGFASALLPAQAARTVHQQLLARTSCPPNLQEPGLALPHVPPRTQLPTRNVHRPTNYPKQHHPGEDTETSLWEPALPGANRMIDITSPPRLPWVLPPTGRLDPDRPSHPVDSRRGS